MLKRSDPPLEIHWNTDEEEAAINAGIEADPDTYVMTDEEWFRATGVRGEDVDAALAAMKEKV